MASVFKVEEEGSKIGNMVMPFEAYYLLDGDYLVRPVTTMGYCADCTGECAGYTWMEDLSKQSVAEDFPDHTETLREARQEIQEWHQRLERLLENRKDPPHCLHCGGTRVTRLGIVLGGDGINPVNGKHYAITAMGQACFLKVPTIFLATEGCRIELPEQRAEQLAQRVRGHFFI